VEDAEKKGRSDGPIRGLVVVHTVQSISSKESVLGKKSDSEGVEAAEARGGVLDVLSCVAFRNCGRTN
jgi:hypothetical protein